MPDRSRGSLEANNAANQPALSSRSKIDCIVIRSVRDEGIGIASSCWVKDLSKTRIQIIGISSIDLTRTSKGGSNNECIL